MFCCVRSAEREPRFHLGAPHLQQIGVRQPRRVPVLVVPVAMGTGVSVKPQQQPVPAHERRTAKTSNTGPSAAARRSGSRGSAAPKKLRPPPTRSGSRCGRRPSRAADRRRRRRARRRRPWATRKALPRCRAGCSRIAPMRTRRWRRGGRRSRETAERRGGERRRGQATHWRGAAERGIAETLESASACNNSSSVRLTCDGEWYGSLRIASVQS